MGVLELKRQGEMECLQSPLLDTVSLVEHGFSTRRGGKSKGAFATLNTGAKSGDQLSLVKENRRIFLKAWGRRTEDAVAAESIHRTNIAVVENKDRGKGVETGRPLAGYDAMVTAQPGVILTAYSADCFLFCLVDPVNKVVSVAHAGWRGVLGGMAYSLADKMKEVYGSSPADLKVAVGPGICSNCFEVGEEVADAFYRRGWNKPACREKDRVTGQHKVNLPEIIRRQFLGAGLKEENLDSSPWCTSCSPLLFYSYRRDRGLTGRMMTFLVLK